MIISVGDKVSIVLYSYDNEPITELYVDPSLIRHIEKRRSFKIAMLQPYNAAMSYEIYRNEVIQINDIQINGQRRHNYFDDYYYWALKLYYKKDSDIIEKMFSEPSIRNDRFYEKNPYKDRDRFIKTISNLCWK